MLKKKEINLNSGDQVWVIERNEAGDPCEFTGYMYLATAGKAVIVSPYINGCNSFDDVMDYHITGTVEDYYANLGVFPIDDCFEFQEEGEKIYKRLLEE